MVGVDLKAYRGIVLVPSGMNVEDFEASVVRRVVGLLCIGADDMRDRVTKSW